MKKHLYLIPLFALSLAALPLAGCDDKTETAPEASESVSESNASPTTVTTEEAAAPTAVEAQQATIIVSNAASFATSPSATTGAIFATISNGSANADFLLAAKTDVATTVEIHQTYEDPQTGATLMRKTAGVDIAANGDTKLDSNSYHIMLLGLTKPLVAGESFNVTLTFREAGDIVVPVTVTEAGIVAPANAADQTSQEDVVTPDATATDATAENTSAPDAAEAHEHVPPTE